MRGVITNVITHTKFFVNRFGDLGVLIPPPRNLGISIGLAGRFYNSVSTGVRHCDIYPVVKVRVELGGTEFPHLLF